jgi:hypothetical protein
MNEETVDPLARQIMMATIHAQAGLGRVGRGRGLTALAQDARLAAEVLLGLRDVDLGPEHRGPDKPKLGRPRKVVVVEQEQTVSTEKNPL